MRQRKRAVNLGTNREINFTRLLNLPKVMDIKVLFRLYKVVTDLQKFFEQFLNLIK